MRNCERDSCESSSPPSYWPHLDNVILTSGLQWPSKRNFRRPWRRWRPPAQPPSGTSGHCAWGRWRSRSCRRSRSGSSCWWRGTCWRGRRGPPEIRLWRGRCGTACLWDSPSQCLQQRKRFCTILILSILLLNWLFVVLWVS